MGSVDEKRAKDCARHMKRIFTVVHKGDNVIIRPDNNREYPGILHFMGDTIGYCIYMDAVPEKKIDTYISICNEINRSYGYAKAYVSIDGSDRQLLLAYDQKLHQKSFDTGGYKQVCLDTYNIMYEIAKQTRRLILKQIHGITEKDTASEKVFGFINGVFNK